MPEAIKEERLYLRQIGLENVADVVAKIAALSSDLNDQQHQIRSSVFDLDAALNVELKRVLYHIFKPMLFLDSEDETQRIKTEKRFNDRIAKLGYMKAYSLLEPIFLSWPLGDLDTFVEINRTRNQIAHGSRVSEVQYRGRSPFEDTDCFAQMYFDVWAAQQAIAKFFDYAITGPREKLRRYQLKFGSGH